VSKPKTTGVSNNSSEGRRERNAAVLATQNNAVDLASTIVIGIVGPVDDRTAILRYPSGKVFKVKKNSRVSGGRVVAIKSDALIVAKGGKSFAMSLKF